MIAADPNTSSTLQTEPQILVALGALTRRPHLVHNENCWSSTHGSA